MLFLRGPLHSNEAKWGGSGEKGRESSQKGRGKPHLINNILQAARREGELS
jgi:hypothetical protein